MILEAIYEYFVNTGALPNGTKPKLAEQGDTAKKEQPFTFQMLQLTPYRSTSHFEDEAVRQDYALRVGAWFYGVEGAEVLQLIYALRGLTNSVLYLESMDDIQNETETYNHREYPIFSTVFTFVCAIKNEVELAIIERVISSIHTRNENKNFTIEATHG